MLECFDPRSRASLSATAAAAALGAAGDSITALRFDDSGLFIAAGTSGAAAAALARLRGPTHPIPLATDPVIL